MKIDAFNDRIKLIINTEEIIKKVVKTIGILYFRLLQEERWFCLTNRN